MSNDGHKRKRKMPNNERLPVIQDDFEFSTNMSSNNARPLCEVSVSLATHLWIDKHYHDRHNFGNEFGKREDIGPEIVEDLVRRAIPHLLFYSTSLKGFIFINHYNPNESPIRIVLIEGEGNNKLNVVIQAHFTELNKFEITVKTALRIEDFRLYQGQYAIEIQGGNSILYRKDNKNVVQVCDI